MHVSSPVAGSTLTSTPVSTTNRHLEIESVRKSKPLLFAAAAAVSSQPGRFPTSRMVACLPKSAMVVTQLWVGDVKRKWGPRLITLLVSSGSTLNYTNSERLYVTAVPECISAFCEMAAVLELCVNKLNTYIFW